MHLRALNTATGSHCEPEATNKSLVSSGLLQDPCWYGGVVLNIPVSSACQGPVVYHGDPQNVPS